MRSIIGTAVLMVGIMLSATSVEAADYSVNIKSISGGVVISGYAPSKCWLGITLDHIDKDVIKVKGSFSHTIPTMAKRVYASLWEDKVKCGNCKYCRANGYHMEGRLASDQKDI